MLSAGIFHVIVQWRVSTQSVRQHGRGRWWMMQNGKKADRLLTLPSAYISSATTSVFTTEGGQVQAGNCYCICIFSLLPCTAFLSPGSSADITYLSTKRGQAEISHPCMLTKMFGLPPACSAYSLTPPCSPLSTACLHKLNPWSAKWTFPVHMCVCVCLCV